MDFGIAGNTAVFTGADSGIEAELAKAAASLETDRVWHFTTKRAQEKKTSFEAAIETFLDEERPTLELHRRGRERGGGCDHGISMFQESQLSERSQCSSGRRVGRVCIDRWRLAGLK